MFSDIAKKLKDPQKRIIYTFGLGEFSFNWFATFVVTQMNIFLTEVVGFSVIVAGIFVTIQYILSMIISPLVGVIFDKAPFRKGKYYPWMQYIPVFNVLAFTIFFLMPVLFSNNKTILTILILITLIVFVIFQTTLFTSYNAIYPCIASDPKDRVISSTIKNIGKMAGQMLSGLIYPVMLVYFASSTFGNSQSKSYVITIAILGSVSILIYYLLSLEIKKSGVEEKVIKRKEKIPMSIMFKELFSNYPLLIIFIVMFLFDTRTFTIMPMTPYYYKYVAQAPTVLAAYLSINGLISICFMACTSLFIKLCKSQKLAFIIALLCAAGCQSLLLFCENSVIAFTVLLALGGGFLSIISVITLNLFAAAVDYGEWKNGKVISGLSMSLYYIAIQASSIISIFVITFSLKFIGFKAGMASSVALSQGIIHTCVYVPTALLILAAILMIFYPLNDKRLMQIREELNKKSSDK